MMEIYLKKPHHRRGQKYIYLGIFLVLSILSAGFLIKFSPHFFYFFWGNRWLVKSETPLTKDQVNAIQKGIQGIRGKIVWASSRTGNHEIFLLSLPDLQMFQLTHNPHVDTFPRFSPDGSKILFCRSQRPWVSIRENDPWDVYLFFLVDNRETLIAPNGNMAQWIDQERISFVRNRKIIIKDLRNGREETILDGTQPKVSAEITSPEFLRRDPNLLVFTGRGKMDGVFVWDRRKDSFLKIGSGCMITWNPSGKEVLWVDNGGNGGTYILKSEFENPRPQVFMDLPGRYSHEYFPRLSQNGQWLVWAATAEGHEPDIMDYEIFLWKVGSPFSDALRLTYNPANDIWPDIFLEK